MPGKGKGSQRHRDAAAVTPPVRPCTPDAQQAEDAGEVPSQRQETPQRPVVPASPFKETATVPPHILMSKFKSLLNDIVAATTVQGGTGDADDFIVVVEEGLRDLRSAKVTAKSKRAIATPSTLNRSSSMRQSQSPQAATLPEDADASDELALSGGDMGDALEKSTNSNSASNVAASYASILRGKTSPKKSRPPAASPGGSKAEELRERNPEAVQEDRAQSAFRSEERQREAETRRREIRAEKQARQAKENERLQLAKERREAAVDRQRSENEEKAARAAKNKSDNIQRVKESAQKVSTRVDEVQYVQQVQQENFALKTAQKHEKAETVKEEIRGEQQKRHKEQAEAHQAVLERNKEVAEAKAERHRAKEQQREEQLKRKEDERRKEAESKQERREERESKVRSVQQKKEEETEEKSRKAAERAQLVEKKREEKARLQKERREKHEEKLKEARERKEREEASKPPSFQTVMPQLASGDEEKQQARINKAMSALEHKGRVFVETYQKDSTLTPKDLNKSKLRAIMTRMIAGTAGGTVNLTQVRQPLHDLLAAIPRLEVVDREHLKYNDSYKTFMDVLVEAHKKHDSATFSLVTDVLNQLFDCKVPSDETPNLFFFIRAGHVLPLIVLIHEEITTLKKHNKSDALTAAFALLERCVGFLCSDQLPARHAALRDMTIEHLEMAGVTTFSLAVAATCSHKDDLPCLLSALQILLFRLELLTRKSTQREDWFRKCVESMLTLLQNLLTPGGHQLAERLPPIATCVVFSALRILNVIGRLRFDFLHDLIGEHAEVGSTASMEVFHVVSAFFKYVSTYDTDLERIAGETYPATEPVIVTPTIQDMLQFGLTHKNLPRIPQDPAAKVPLMLRAALHELLLFVGYISMGDGRVQDVFAWGKETPLVSIVLSALPIQYFAICKHVLFPSLICLAFEHDRNLSIMGGEMDTSALGQFLREEIAAIPPKQRWRLKERLAREESEGVVGEDVVDKDNKSPSLMSAAALAEEKAHQQQQAPATGQLQPGVVTGSSPKKSWAEMMDEDDDMSALINPPELNESFSASSVTSSEAEQRARDKSALIRSVVGSNKPSLKARSSHAHHFHLARRFPMHMWETAAEYFAPTTK